MAELGSHQLDAASIFIAAAHDGREAASAQRGRRRQPAAVPARPRRRGPRLLHLRVPAARLRPARTRSPAARRSACSTPRSTATVSAATAKRCWAPRARSCWRPRRRRCSSRPTRRPARRKVVAAKSGGQEGRACLQVDEERRSRVGRHRHPGRLARRSRLHRGVGALGVVHPQPDAGEPAALPPQGGPGRRGDRADDQPGRPARARGSSSRTSGSTSTATRRRKASSRTSRGINNPPCQNSRSTSRTRSVRKKPRGD